jgi:diguanylate cyclase (GGDEF)-like protein
MTRLKQAPGMGRRARISVIDDDVGLLRSLQRLLEFEGHDVRGSSDPTEGVQIVRDWKPELVLLDYCMPVMNGPEVVRAIRQFDSLTQVVLVTGYAEEHPARQLLTELDIQGFHDKADGPQRLLVLVDAALKHHQALVRLDRQRRGLQHIVEASPRLTRLQPMNELFSVALEEVRPLLGGGDSLVATQNSGLFVFDHAPEGVVIRAGTGRFQGLGRMSELDPAAMTAVQEGLAAELPLVYQDQFVLIPMWTRDHERGCVVVEGARLNSEAVELCRLFGLQVIQSLENLALWERATTDGLTRLCNRAFGAQRLEEIRSLDLRQGNASSVFLIDLDRFKDVNDRYGHAAGDLTLRSVATAIRTAGRRSDVTARWGGEEFLMVLPDTGEDEALVVAERVRRAVEDLRLPFEGSELRPTVSIGVSTALAGDRRPTGAIVSEADDALYAAKRAGRNRVCDGRMSRKAAA